jgi:hypothetical protein
MLQVFQMNIAKVDRDVAMVVHVCCKRSITNVSSVFSRCMLQVCLSRCCICFTHMLHVFCLDVAYGYNGFQVFSGVFLSVSEACFMCL